MTQPLLLTAAELRELTKHRRCDAQMRELSHMGIPHGRRSDGSLVVIRSVVQQLLGAETAGAMLPDPEPELCFEPPQKKRSTSATVRVLQTRGVLVREGREVAAPGRKPV